VLSYNFGLLIVIFVTIPCTPTKLFTKEEPSPLGVTKFLPKFPSRLTKYFIWGRILLFLSSKNRLKKKKKSENIYF
jgi:hypothetical protein